MLAGGTIKVISWEGHTVGDLTQDERAGREHGLAGVSGALWLDVTWVLRASHGVSVTSLLLSPHRQLELMTKGGFGGLEHSGPSKDWTRELVHLQEQGSLFLPTPTSCDRVASPLSFPSAPNEAPQGLTDICVPLPQSGKRMNCQ